MAIHLLASVLALKQIFAAMEAGSNRDSWYLQNVLWCKGLSLECTGGKIKAEVQINLQPSFTPSFWGCVKGQNGIPDLPCLPHGTQFQMKTNLGFRLGYKIWSFILLLTSCKGIMFTLLSTTIPLFHYEELRDGIWVLRQAHGHSKKTWIIPCPWSGGRSEDSHYISQVYDGILKILIPFVPTTHCDWWNQ